MIIDTTNRIMYTAVEHGSHQQQTETRSHCNEVKNVVTCTAVILIVMRFPIKLVWFESVNAFRLVTDLSRPSSYFEYHIAQYQVQCIFTSGSRNDDIRQLSHSYGCGTSYMLYCPDIVSTICNLSSHTG